MGLLLLPMALLADEQPYLCEIGLQGGCGYYVGEAAPHIFQDVNYAAGLHFRYKFDKRWSIKVNGMYQVIKGPYQDYREPNNKKLEEYVENKKLTAADRWNSSMVNMDVTAEFNFLRFGMPEYDTRIKPYTPYLFLGIGAAVIPGPRGEWTNVAAYLPVGLGFKWQFSKRCALHVAWQHNIYFSDDLENVWMKNEEGKMINPLGNTYDLNKANVMNMDISSQLTVGFVFAFAAKKKICRTCEQEK